MEIFNDAIQFFDDVIQALGVFVDFILNGIYVFFEELLKQLVSYLVISFIKFKIWALQFSWEVAKTIMTNLSVGDYIDIALSQLDSVLIAYLNFFRVLDALNLIIQAYITRLTLYVMGW